MPMFSIFDIAGSGMSAQSVRLNTVASNLANVNSVGSDPDQVYRARQPVFAAALESIRDQKGGVGTRLVGVVEKQEEPVRRYDPGNPLANEEGYIWETNVDPVEEMVNMIAASRAFQNNVEVLNTSKQLMLATLRLGE